MKNKVIIFTLILSMSAAIGLHAQNLPGNIWSSPQSITTEGRFRNNADDFIRPDAYTGVNLDKWFGLVSFLWDEATYGAIMTAGFATKVKNLYVGTFYTGNFWTNAPVNNYIEQEPAVVPSGGTVGKVYDVYTSAPSVGGATNPVNNAAVLIGIADMGFRLTFRTNYQSFNENDIVTGDQLYKNYQIERGYLAGQIAWAMAKDLTKNGIRPYMGLDLVFDRDYQKTTTEGPDSDGNTGAKTGYSLNYFAPEFSAGLGGYTFYNQNSFRVSCDIDYVLGLKTYDNEYWYDTEGENKTGRIKGIYSPGNNPYMEKFYFSNLITPSISGSWSGNRIALKIKLNLPFMISGEDQNSMDIDSSGNLFYDGASKSISTFTFQPDLRLAMQYYIVPDRFILNLGARIQATVITKESVIEAYYNNNVKTASQKLHQDTSGGSFVSYFHIGSAFYFTENVWIEATTGVTKSFGNQEAIEIFAPGGLFSFGRIMVAMKF